MKNESILFPKVFDMTVRFFYFFGNRIIPIANISIVEFCLYLQCFNRSSSTVNFSEKFL